MGEAADVTDAMGRVDGSAARRRRPILLRLSSAGEADDVAALVVRVRPHVTMVWYNARLLPRHRSRMTAWGETQLALGARPVRALRIEELPRGRRIAP
jgi:hypothetical protein